MRLPKLRELKEAVTAVFSPRFTTRFPARPCVVPERYRGKPEFNDHDCVGCGACVNVCPTQALTRTEDLAADPPMRRITLSYDTCIFCGNCSENCTTKTGIALSRQWDLAGLDRKVMKEHHDYELQLCEKCGAVVGTKKHLIWIAEKLGSLAYSNPSLVLAKNQSLMPEEPDVRGKDNREPEKTVVGDFMRILCPECKCRVNIQL